MDSDWRLIHRIRCGNESAIESFVRKFYPSVLKYCRFRVYEQAEDLAQETFVKFFKSVTSYKHKGKLQNYLYVIAGNLCRDYWREQNRILRTESNEEIQIGIEDDKEQLVIKDAVNRLPKEFNEVIYLHFFLDMSLQEIADVEGIKISLVKYRLRRGKEMLRKSLCEETGL